MTYQLTTGDTILRLSDNAFIPKAPGNKDYREYLDWLAKGNTPEPAPVPPAPEPRTPQQKLEALGLTVPELRALLGLPDQAQGGNK